MNDLQKELTNVSKSKDELRSSIKDYENLLAEFRAGFLASQTEGKRETGVALVEIN